MGKNHYRKQNFRRVRVLYGCSDRRHDWCLFTGLSPGSRWYFLQVSSQLWGKRVRPLVRLRRLLATSITISITG